MDNTIDSNEIDMSKVIAFTETMHGYSTTLMVFVKLLNAWSSLTSKEKGAVFDYCQENHPNTYHGMFPKE